MNRRNSSQILEAPINTSGSLNSILNGNNGIVVGAVCHQKNASINSAEEPLCVADVAELLHPQYAIITGELVFTFFRIKL